MLRTYGSSGATALLTQCATLCGAACVLKVVTNFGEVDVFAVAQMNNMQFAVMNSFLRNNMFFHSMVVVSQKLTPLVECLYTTMIPVGRVQISVSRNQSISRASRASIAEEESISTAICHSGPPQDTSNNSYIHLPFSIPFTIPFSSS